MNIQEIIELKKTQLSETVKKTGRVFLVEKQGDKIVAKLTHKEFEQLIKLNAEIIIRGRNLYHDYVIDESNKELIQQLYYYAIGSNDFSGDYHKGLFISGKNGTGKTILLRAFANIIQDFSTKIITNIHVKKIPKVLKEKGLDYLDLRPLYIEDLGKETKEINDFGTKRNTIPDIMAERYERGAWTFVCCNYKDETLEKFYGLTITDRFKEMFNFFELNGETKRNKYKVKK